MVRERQRHVFVVGMRPQVPRMLKAALAPLLARITCFDGRDGCLEQLPRGACDVLIVDLDGYTAEGTRLLAEARRLCPWVTSFALIDEGNVPGAIQAMKAGAADCLERPLNEEGLRSAIGPALARTPGKTPAPDAGLTRAEKRVLNLVATGQTSDQIAAVLRRSRRTIDVHRAHVMRKLGVSGTMDLIKEAARRGLIRLDGAGGGGAG